MLLGRADDQVKIRGFRVEPGEVEAALGSPRRRSGGPGARARGHAGRPSAHVGWARTDAGAAVDPRLAVRAFLSSTRLPGYWCRAGDRPLDADAVDAGGEDEPATPAVGRSGPRRPANRSVTAREEVVCGIFAESSGWTGSGPQDDFFALGGHSLLATQVVSRISSALDEALSPASLFQTPTPRALAAASSSGQRGLHGRDHGRCSARIPPRCLLPSSSCGSTTS